MARVPYVADEDLVEPARTLVLGHPIALYRALANSPGGLECFAAMGSWIRYRSRLDPRLRELLILAVGAIADCSYELGHHVKISRDFGCSDEDVRGVVAAARGAASTLGDVETLLVQAAREITDEGVLGDRTHEALAARFDDELLVEIVLIAAHYASVVRVLESLQVDVEPDYQRYLEELSRQP